MRYVAAYLLAVMGGNESPSKADIEKILGSVGIDSDAQSANGVVSALQGKSVSELLEQGKEKLASVPTGMGAGPAGGGGAPAAAAAESAPAEKKEEEKKEESESDEDLGFGLFD